MLLSYLSWRVDVRREFLGIPFFPHGVLIALGFLAGSWVLSRHTRRRGLPQAVLWDVVTWVMIGAIAGTRLLWVAGNWSELESPAEILTIWHGGMTLYGGILGGLVAGTLKVRRLGLPVLPMLDFAAPGLALGLILGRASDLVTGDHLGKPTTLPWGFRYVGDNPPGVPPPHGAIVHPVALYDLVSVAALFLVLLAFLRKDRAAGSAAVLFGLWYAAGRIGLDFLRTDAIRAFGLTGTQLASMLLVPAVLTWLAARARRDRQGWPPSLDLPPAQGGDLREGTALVSASGIVGEPEDVRGMGS